jgi:DHA2 family multidrug resistance protein
MAEAAQGAESGGVAPAARLPIVLAVMSATLIQVLDTTIVNVALPHMQGELGTTADQVSWVLTSYLIASAIFMPLTGFFADVMGRKRFLMISIAGFVAASALCGIAQNLAEIVGARILQGVFGAALVPLSQAIMRDAYPPAERGHAMAIWGMGVMVGPILGPTLGGWLTDIATWRWNFYINVPVGALSLWLAMRFVPDTPVKKRGIDWTGFALLSLAVATLQYVLDRGNRQDWFAGLDIRVCAAVALVCGGAFVWHVIRNRGASLFDLSIFADRNFTTACLMMLALGLAMFGGMIVQPTLLEGLLGFPIVTAGIYMAPRGVASAVSMMIVGRLLKTMDPRLLIGAGMLISAGGSFAMTHYSLDVSRWWLVWPAAVQGFGMGLIFVPLSTLAYATLARAKAAEAAGLYSLVRTIGQATGISIVTTLMSREGQVLWNSLGGHVSRFNPDLMAYLRSLHLSPTDPRAAALLAEQVGRQSSMLAMIDVFELIAWTFVVMLPLLLLMRGQGGRRVS